MRLGWLLEAFSFASSGWLLITSFQNRSQFLLLFCILGITENSSNSKENMNLKFLCFCFIHTFGTAEGGRFIYRWEAILWMLHAVTESKAATV